MKEALDSVKHLHQFVIAASAAVLAFALSGSDTRVNEAIKELRALKAIDWTGYVPFVENEVYREAAKSAYSPQRAQLDAVRDSLGSLIDVPADPCFLPTETCARVELPMATHLPDASTSLEGYESFLVSRPAVFWARFDRFSANRPFPRERARLSRMAVRPRLQGRFLHGGTDWYFDGDPPLAAVPGNVVLTLAGASPAVFEGNADVYVTLLADATPAHWLLQTQKELVGRSMLDPSASHFVSVRKYWNSVSAKPIDAAIGFLQDRADASRKQMSLFGLAMDADTVGILGPLSVAALLVFLLAHVRHLASLDPHDEFARTYPWICLSTDWLGIALTFSTVVLLPAAASAALVVRALANLREAGRASVIIPGAMTVVVVTLSILTFSAIRTLRRRLAALAAARSRERLSVPADDEASPFP
ncbi:MAG: hypothetical protein E6J62_09460 [Deltaproteobacteria bacterium]|nr:MAG: hypothetical protein E6J62_09460 [Deltaproteobacteria bacterium]